MGKYKKLQNKFYNYKLKTEIRFDKIEKHLGLNTEVTVSKMESVEELPEKWCVKIKEENIPYLNEYLNNQKSKYKGSSEFWKVDTVGAYFLSENQKECFHSTYKEPKGYTKITFDQFKKWVLKEDEKQMIKDVQELSLETTARVMAKYEEKEKPLSIREVQVKVNSQEEANECAEIAKDCGYSISKIMSSASSRNDYFSYNFSKGIEGFGFYGFDPLQTEISIQEYRERFGKSTEIDWSKAGQLLTDGYFIIITNGKHSKDFFSGSVIKKDDNFNIGNFFDSNKKSDFKLCTEPITLSN